MTASLLLGATLAVACAGNALAYKPTVIKEGWPPVELNSGFSPRKLPKKKLAPIHLSLSGRVNAAVGTHPSPLEEAVFEIDRNMAIAARGLPVCRLMIDVPDPCKAARVGKGEMEVEIELPETQPFSLEGHADVFNMGAKDGVKTIAMVTRLRAPVTATVVIRFEVSKVRQGRYGARWTATIPLIAGGNGWVKSLDLELFRRFGYKGKKRSYLLAKCPDGKLLMRWEARFADDSEFSGRAPRACTPEG